ncbi:MAG: S16 family serine protease [Verrucomicrobiota bacterium]
MRTLQALRPSLIVLTILFYSFTGISSFGQNSGNRKSSASLSASAVEIHAVWFRDGDEGPEGGTSPVNVRVFPNNSGTASIGLLEEFFGGTGNMWRTATWIAAFNASTIHGSSIVDHEYLVKVGGHIDGPSAGMLTTVAMLAALRGETVRSDTTMTGTINPDGTAGVVGGIVHKMEGAKNSGFKRFGYPVGTRSSVDMGTNTLVDLNAKGTELGMEAREIRDIYEAYHFLTGKRLPRPQPVYESDLELPAPLRANIQGWSNRVRQELEQRYQVIQSAMQNNPMFAQTVGGMVGAIELEYDVAQDFANSGMPAAAYYRFLTADAQARTVESVLGMFQAAATENIDVLSDHLQTIEDTNGDKLDAFEQLMRDTVANRKLGGRVDALNNMSQFAQSYAYFRMGVIEKFRFLDVAENWDEIVQSNGQEAAMQELLLRYIYTSLFYNASGVLVEYAEDWLSLASSQGPEIDVSPEKFEALARAYASAGASCVSYFDALITEPRAEAAGVTKSTMQEQIKMTEFTYPFASMMAEYSEWAEGVYQTPDPVENSMFKLGAGSSAYLYGATLVNKYYSLDAQFQDDGTIKLGNKRVLGVMLDRARQKVLEEAGEFQEKYGFVPDSVKLNFQLATALREGDDDDKLESLQAYWFSAHLCDIAFRMAD